MTKICAFKLALILEPKLRTGVGSIFVLKNHEHHLPSKPWYAPTPDRQKLETEETADSKKKHPRKETWNPQKKWQFGVDGSPFPLGYVDGIFSFQALSWHIFGTNVDLHQTPSTVEYLSSWLKNNMEDPTTLGRRLWASCQWRTYGCGNNLYVLLEAVGQPRMSKIVRFATCWAEFTKPPRIQDLTWRNSRQLVQTSANFIPNMTPAAKLSHVAQFTKCTRPCFCCAALSDLYGSCAQT